MSEKKYSFRREGNHFKLSIPINEKCNDIEEMTPKKQRFTFKLLSLKTIFDILGSIVVLIVGFLIATPLFLMSILLNWFKLTILFAIFWFIVYVVYDTVILNHTALGIRPFNGTIVLIIMGLGLIASIFVTISEIKN